MLDVEVVTRNAAERLGELAGQAEFVRAAVAYWTLPPRSIDPTFLEALSHPKGFLCTDIHYPTSIDELAEFRRQGANISLYLYSLSGKTEVESAKGVPNHLLHSKVFLFDCPNDRAFAWVGSHNGTYRALHDINTECSVLMALDRQSSQYAKIEAHLEAIRRKSTAFDLGDLEYYKMLQGRNEGVAVIEVMMDPSHSLLQRDSKITVFGSVPRDFDGLKSVDKDVFLSVLNSLTGEERFYRATIDQSGNLGKGEKLIFPARRYVMRDGRRLPDLHPHGDIPAEIYQRARYFVTLTIHDVLPATTRGLEVEQRDRAWEDASAEVLCDYSGSANESRKQLVSVDNKKLKVKQARSKQIVLCDLAMKFDDRKKLEDHALIRRRILVQD